jgi:hypothetical protein
MERAPDFPEPRFPEDPTIRITEELKELKEKELQVSERIKDANSSDEIFDIIENEGFERILAKYIEFGNIYLKLTKGETVIPEDSYLFDKEIPWSLLPDEAGIQKRVRELVSEGKFNPGAKFPAEGKA